MDTGFQWDDLQHAVETPVQAGDGFGYGQFKDVPGNLHQNLKTALVVDDQGMSLCV